MKHNSYQEIEISSIQTLWVLESIEQTLNNYNPTVLVQKKAKFKKITT